MKAKLGDSGSGDTIRIAIVEKDRCKPKKCALECKKSCPVNRTGKMCISVEKTNTISTIAEELCVGCGICVKKCPFEAIQIINLPKNLEKDTTHRYGPNTFKLHRLPVPRERQVLGLVGTNGIGKSTALQILAGKLKPNLGNFQENVEWDRILQNYKGSELQTYFKKLLEESVKATIKPQYVDLLPRAIKGLTRDILKQKDQRKDMDHLVKELVMDEYLDKDIANLSGGELQRLAIAIVCLQDVTVYMFDEPSSYLDVKQRLKAAHVIREMAREGKYVIVVEHDLSVLDYLSDYICCLYGQAAAYGVVTMPFSVREGINIFLAGFIPTENMRFRDHELNFKIADNLQEIMEPGTYSNSYPTLVKKYGSGFELEVEGGKFNSSQINVLLGENGTGKTTLVKILAGQDEDLKSKIPLMNISYKPQKITPKFEGSVRDLLFARIKNIQETSELFKNDVYKPMIIDPIIDNSVQKLSGNLRSLF